MPSINDTTKQLLVSVILLTLACVLPYLNAIHGEFVLDDIAFYVDNNSFTADHNLARFFYTSMWEHSVLHSKEDVLYRPLFMVVMWITQTVFGDNVIGHHLFSISLHLITTLLLLTLLRRLLPDTGWIPPLIGALIFAVHPVHSEAVAWIGPFGHLLITALLLGGLLCYIKHLETPTWYWLSSSAALFTCALFSGEIAVVFPLLITAYEYLHFRRLQWRRIALFWLILAFYFAIRKLVLTQSIPLSFDSLTAWGNAFSFAIGYLEQLVLPWPQFFYLTVPPGGIITPTSGILAFLLIVGAGVLTRLRLPNRTVLLFGLSWIILALSVPILAALNPSPMFALRSLYLPSVGISIFIAWATAVALPKYRSTVWATIILIVIISIPTTWLANRDWLNNFRVYEKIFSISPNASGAGATLAEMQEKQGSLKMAEKTLLRAAEYASGKTSKIDVYSRLGLLYGTQGEATKSSFYFEQVINLDPKRSSAWVGQGNNAWTRGNIKAALDNYLRAQELDPNNQEARHNASLAYQMLRNR
jgi:tetratricopeptide (TPR) repeat protein